MAKELEKKAKLDKIRRDYELLELSQCTFKPQVKSSPPKKLEK